MPKQVIKYAAVIIHEGKYLIAKQLDSDTWINVGGKPQGDESPEQCLQREIMEELSVKVISQPVLYLESPFTPAVSDPNIQVKIIWYKLEIEGEPVASSEIGEIHWLTKSEAETDALKLSPQIKEFLIPKLVADGFLN